MAVDKYPAISLNTFYLLKKPGTIDCEAFHAITLMNVDSNNNEKNKKKNLNKDFWDQQYGFVEGKVTNNAVHILRTLIERMIKIDLFV